MNKEAEKKFKRAHQLFNSKKYADALKEYKGALELDQNDARYWISMGVCLLRIGHRDQAIEKLSRGIELKPHYGEQDARLFLAEAYEGQKNLKKAKEQWSIVANMDAEYPSYNDPIEEAKKKLKSSNKSL